jgi:DNA-binding SARP family transcriptional activator/DNA-binding HxlR family transcriptional regulator
MQLGIWALGVVSVALKGTATHVAEFGEALGIPPLLLAPSLDDLVGAGLMELRASGSDRRYLLTDHGRDLHDTVTALDLWNDRWVEPVADVALPPDVEQLIAAAVPAKVEISLLGGFSMTVDGVEVSGLANGSQRLLIFLALHDRTVSRVAMASAMWPDATTRRAAVSLRSALARLDAPTRAGVVAVSATLALAHAVSVDLVDARALAHRLLDDGVDVGDQDLTARAIATLSCELLPDWFDEWVLAEAEEWRALRASALENLALRLMKSGRLAEAKRAAGIAVRIDPLRESPSNTLIRIHLAEGNQSEALATFDKYSLELREALDLSPTEQLSGLVSDLQR